MFCLFLRNRSFMLNCEGLACSGGFSGSFVFFFWWRCVRGGGGGGGNFKNLQTGALLPLLSPQKF